MGAVADWRRVRRLGRYLVRDRRRLLVALLLLLPLAFAGALQPVLLGQAVSVLRGEPSLPFLSGRTPLASAISRGSSINSPMRSTAVSPPWIWVKRSAS